MHSAACNCDVLENYAASLKPKHNEAEWSHSSVAICGRNLFVSRTS